MQAILQLKQFICRNDGEVGFPPELSGYAAQAAARVLLNNWQVALADGSKHNLVADIDDVINLLHAFKLKAIEVLPATNSGQAKPETASMQTGDVMRTEKVVFGDYSLNLQLGFDGKLSIGVNSTDGTAAVDVTDDRVGSESDVHYQVWTENLQS